ncbi:hypothetical protein D3C81_2021480 [compost metagenome]
MGQQVLQGLGSRQRWNRFTQFGRELREHVFRWQWLAGEVEPDDQGGLGLGAEEFVE